MRLIVCLLVPYFYNLALLSLGFLYEEYFYLYPLGYLPLICLMLVEVLATRKRINSKLVSLIALTSLFSLPTAISYQGVMASVIIYLSTVFTPWLAYFYFHSNRNQINNYYKYLLIFTLVHFLMIPVEISVLGRATIMNLQYSGGQYYLFGTILFALTIAHYFIQVRSFKSTLDVLAIVVGLISFSRVGISLAILYFTFSFFSAHIMKPKNLAKILPVFGVAIFLWNRTFDDFGAIVLTRFNVYSNVTKKLALQGGVFSGSDDRFNFVSYLFQRDYYEILFGSGIGATEEALSLLSNGNIAYGSLHNLLLTAFFERGVSLLIILVVIGIYIINNFRKRTILIISSIFFFSTGTDLFVNSKIFNIDFSLLITIMILLFNETRSQEVRSL